MKRITDKVLILGTMPTWKEAPLNDPTWEVWGMNAMWELWEKYATRWFEIHEMSVLMKDGWRKNYAWLSTCPIPVYMAKHYARIPNSVPYPLADVSKGFLKQFSSTFCYEMALAIHEGFKTIGLYGMAFSGGTFRERFIESKGVLYWLGVAAGRGIKIEFDSRKEREFVHRYLYGMEYWEETDDVRQQIRLPFDIAITNIIDGLGLKYFQKIT